MNWTRMSLFQFALDRLHLLIFDFDFEVIELHLDDVFDEFLGTHRGDDGKPHCSLSAVFVYFFDTLLT